MNYVGIDWAYGCAAWCAISESGAIADEGLIPAGEDGPAKLVLKLGTEIKACVEMMSGAIWAKAGSSSRAGISRSPEDVPIVVELRRRSWLTIRR